MRGDLQHLDGVFEGAENSRVDHVAGRPHDEHVAESLIEDDLGGEPRVRAAEQHDVRMLTPDESRAVLDTLAGMLRFTCHKSVVAVAQDAPRVPWCVCGHAQ